MAVPVVYQEESYAIVGACFEVYNEKGPGFLEAVYQECLEIEFRLRGIPFVAQGELTLSYKGQPLKRRYQPDFLCYEKIVLEVKAVAAITPDHLAQIHNYLKASRLRLGLLVNFGNPQKLEYQRIVR